LARQKEMLAIYGSSDYLKRTELPLKHEEVYIQSTSHNLLEKVNAIMSEKELD